MVPTSPRGYLASNAYGLRNHVCVIPCGGLLGDANTHWSKEQLNPYVHYVIQGRNVDHLFKGFVFSGIRVRADHFIHPLFAGFGNPSDMSDWTLWADLLFSSGSNLHALSETATGEKRDVWVSLPYPHSFQRAFGVVHNKTLDFMEETDRLAAVTWWGEQWLARWNQRPQLHAKLQFRGFLWQRETIDTSDRPLVASINAWIHRRGYASMWLPNYGSIGVSDWEQLGFDVVALNTNYTGNTNYDQQWIRNTAMFAAGIHAGIQLVWGKGLIYNPHHPLDHWNLGLPAYHGYMSESFVVHQFPNQRLDVLQQTSFVNYVRLYTFIKGLYQKVPYPGIPY